MFRALRFSITLLLTVWLGVLIAVSFFVAAHLFRLAKLGDEWVPHTTAAADIIGPLLRQMDVTAWVAIPLAIALLLLMARGFELRSRRPIAVAALLLVAALGASIYNGAALTEEIHAIRVELRREFGGYHLSPAEHPERRRFGMLHGISQSLAMLELAFGLGALFCVTQLIEPARRSEESA
jgi:hypothetical protein